MMLKLPRDLTTITDRWRLASEPSPSADGAASAEADCCTETDVSAILNTISSRNFFFRQSLRQKRHDHIFTDTERALTSCRNQRKVWFYALNSLKHRSAFRDKSRNCQRLRKTSKTTSTQQTQSTSNVFSLPKKSTLILVISEHQGSFLIHE